MQSENKTIFYKRARFITHLPGNFLYSPSHYWIAEQENNLWRIGLTKFATRMLGEMVDHGIDVEACAPVVPGQVIGWVEGFKALSDVFCIAEGQFVGSNPILKEKVILLGSDCYRSGWLYEVRGKPDEKCMDVQAYCSILDTTIDKILEKEKEEEK